MSYLPSRPLLASYGTFKIDPLPDGHARAFRRAPGEAHPRGAAREVNDLGPLGPALWQPVGLPGTTRSGCRQARAVVKSHSIDGAPGPSSKGAGVLHHKLTRVCGKVHPLDSCPRLLPAASQRLRRAVDQVLDLTPTTVSGFR